MDKIVFILDSSDYNLDEIKQGIAEGNDRNIEDVSDDEAYDEISYLLEEDWHNFLSECGNEKDMPVVVTGYFMSWMGPQRGGKVYSSLKDACSNIIMDESTPIWPIWSFDDNGVFVLNETHHDAPCSGNHYEFRVLTAKGNQYYKKHIDDDRMNLCETLANNSEYNRNVNPKIFGM